RYASGFSQRYAAGVFLAVRDRGFLGSAVLLQQVGGLLLGGAIQLLIEVGEVFRDLTATGAHRLGVQAAGAVAGTNQRAGHDSREAHVISSLGVRHELLRADPTLDRVVHGGRAQVLGNREDVGARLAQVTHGLHDLLLGL